LLPVTELDGSSPQLRHREARRGGREERVADHRDGHRGEDRIANESEAAPVAEVEDREHQQAALESAGWRSPQRATSAGQPAPTAQVLDARLDQQPHRALRADQVARVREGESDAAVDRRRGRASRPHEAAASRTSWQRRSARPRDRKRSRDGQRDPPMWAMRAARPAAELWAVPYWITGS